MACKLTVSNDPAADFEAVAGGAPVQLDVHGTAGQAAILPGTSYAGQPLQAPWQFVIAQGYQPLDVVIANPVVGDMTTLEEVCDPDPRNSLLTFQSVPGGPVAHFIIKGI
jgi:hypothetical protein